MKETDLSDPVCRWLRERGLVPYCEVPAQGCCVDIVGIATERVVAVELKLSLSRSVLRQAVLAQLFADEAWCAVPTKPRSLDRAKQYGLGVLRVCGDEVSVLALPTGKNGMPFPATQADVLRVINLMKPGGIAGRQSPINDGPAQEVARLVAPLRRAGKSWAEIFATVPSQYANPKSMQSVMLGYAPARAILKADAGAER